MSILGDFYDEQIEEYNRKHYGEEAYLLIKKYKAEALDWKIKAKNNELLRNAEVKRLQAIIESQRQSHGWQIAELEKENAALKLQIKELQEKNV